jgi:hypothetical protein
MKKALFLLLLLFPVIAVAQNEEVKVPDEVKPFVERGMIPIALESGDLNGDGIKDYILVLSAPAGSGGANDDSGIALRPTIILVRDSSGKLTVAARNDQVAYCRECGGVLGDPFQGVQIQGSGFKVSNYGGSSWRWSNEFRFAYSRRDQTWELTRVEEVTFNALDAGKEKKTVYTPPKDFGLINFADFNPESYKGKGKK